MGTDRFVISLCHCGVVVSAQRASAAASLPELPCNTAKQTCSGKITTCPTDLKPHQFGQCEMLKERYNVSKGLMESENIRI